MKASPGHLIGRREGENYADDRHYHSTEHPGNNHQELVIVRQLDLEVIQIK